MLDVELPFVHIDILFRVNPTGHSAAGSSSGADWSVSANGRIKSRYRSRLPAL
jgi:hypothetical protein